MQKLEPHQRATCHRQMVSLTQGQADYVKRFAGDNDFKFSEAMRAILEYHMASEKDALDKLLELLKEQVQVEHTF